MGELGRMMGGQRPRSGAHLLLLLLLLLATACAAVVPASSSCALVRACGGPCACVRCVGVLSVHACACGCSRSGWRVCRAVHERARVWEVLPPCLYPPPSIPRCWMLTPP